MRSEEEYIAKAQRLMDMGYRRTSRKHCMLSRIDRPDWREHMAKEHAPWDPYGEGLNWVESLGEGSAAAFYRSVHSKDVIVRKWDIVKHVRSSGHDPVDYIPKEREMATTKLNTRRDPTELTDMYKVHSMSVVRGEARGDYDSFHVSFESALERCHSIVERDPSIQMVILKVTHVVQSSTPPIDVIEV